MTKIFTRQHRTISVPFALGTLTVLIYSRFSVKWRGWKNCRYVCTLLIDRHSLRVFIATHRSFRIYHTFEHPIVIFLRINRPWAEHLSSQPKRFSICFTITNIMNCSATFIVDDVEVLAHISSPSRSCSTRWNPSPAIFLEVYSRVSDVWGYMIVTFHWSTTFLFVWMLAFHCWLVFGSWVIDHRKRSEFNRQMELIRSSQRTSVVMPPVATASASNICRSWKQLYILKRSSCIFLAVNKVSPYSVLI